jgi:hypothetical protein
MWDYEPVDGSTIPDLEALVRQSSLPAAFEEYVLGFTVGVRQTQREQGTRGVIFDCHFAVQLNHFIPVFLLVSYSAAVFLK